MFFAAKIKSKLSEPIVCSISGNLSSKTPSLKEYENLSSSSDANIFFKSTFEPTSNPASSSCPFGASSSRASSSIYKISLSSFFLSILLAFFVSIDSIHLVFLRYYIQHVLLLREIFKKFFKINSRTTNISV